jgi:hypothetical protein
MQISKKVGALLIASLGLACAQDGGIVDDGAIGAVEMAITSVPTGVGCVVVAATGGIMVKKNFNVTAGASVKLSMGGLPVGSVKLDAAAYAGVCPPSSAATALWVAETKTVTLVGGISTPVTLTLRKAAGIDATIDFNGNACQTGLSLCGTSCVNLSSDVKNCGACGNACLSGASCSNGVCAGVCPKLICSGTCVDPATDPNNCGTCGRACSAGAVCSGGTCACPKLICNGTCVDPATDPRNCGTCGVVCLTTCKAGICQ